jgi:hypothetical protein
VTNFEDDPAVAALRADGWESQDGPMTVEDLARIVSVVRRSDWDQWMLGWLEGGTGFPAQTEDWFNHRIRSLNQGSTITGDTTMVSN